MAAHSFNLLSMFLKINWYAYIETFTVLADLGMKLTGLWQKENFLKTTNSSTEKVS